MWFAILAGLAALGYLVFRPKPRMMEETELECIRCEVEQLMAPDPMDFETVVIAKKSLQPQINYANTLLNRAEPIFSSKEYEMLSGLVSETRGLLKITDPEAIRGSLIVAMEASKEALASCEKAISLHRSGVAKGSDEFNEEDEDSIDLIENMLEDLLGNVKVWEERLERLDYSITKY